MSNSGKLTSVKAAAGEAQMRLLYCDTCPNTLASDWSDSTSYDWCLNLMCRGCQSTWSVCRLCRQASSRFTCRRLLSRHNARNHRPKVVVTVPSTARAVETLNEQPASSMMDVQRADASNMPDDYLLGTNDDNFIESFDGSATEFTGDRLESTEDRRAVFPNESVWGDDIHDRLDFQSLGNAISSFYFQ